MAELADVVSSLEKIQQLLSLEREDKLRSTPKAKDYHEPKENDSSFLNKAQGLIDRFQVLKSVASGSNVSRIPSFLQGSIDQVGKAFAQPEPDTIKDVARNLTQTLSGTPQNASGVTQAATQAIGAAAPQTAAATATGAATATEGAEGVAAAAGGILAIPGVGEVVAIGGLIVSLSAAFVGLINATKQMATSFLESQRDLAQFNSGLSETFSKWDMFNLNMKINTAEGLDNSGGIDFLEKQLEDFITTLTPYIAGFTALFAYTIGGIVATMDFIVGLMEKLMLIVAEGLDHLPGISGIADSTKNILHHMRRKDNNSTAGAWVDSLSADYQAGRMQPLGAAGAAGAIAGKARRL